MVGAVIAEVGRKALEEEIENKNKKGSVWRSVGRIRTHARIGFRLFVCLFVMFVLIIGVLEQPRLCSYCRSDDASVCRTLDSFGSDVGDGFIVD